MKTIYKTIYGFWQDNKPNPATLIEKTAEVPSDTITGYLNAVDLTQVPQEYIDLLEKIS